MRRVNSDRNAPVCSTCSPERSAAETHIQMDTIEASIYLQNLLVKQPENPPIFGEDVDEKLRLTFRPLCRHLLRQCSVSNQNQIKSFI